MDSASGGRVVGYLAVAIGCEVSDAEAKVVERHGWCDVVEEGCFMNSRVDVRHSGINVTELWISSLALRRFWRGYFDVRRSRVERLDNFWNFIDYLRGDLPVLSFLEIVRQEAWQLV